MSITVKLPDGSVLEYDGDATAARVAQDISPSLARMALAASIDGRLCDLTRELTDGTHEVLIITERQAEGLEVLRHTAAHVLAQAVVRLYGPQVQYTIGPALTGDFQYGFYYDFDLGETVSSDDLPKIEAEMKRIVAAKYAIDRSEL
ncbi:MAG: TGS domain-containing protein, partial [Planctomycetes bacterium]|nr:TGS domain-containing protein [Planctomycetota bacterium]